MKIHVGSEVDYGDANTVSFYTANVAYVTELPNLLREDDRAPLDDACYVNNL